MFHVGSIAQFQISFQLALLETNSEWQVVEVRSNRDVITYACCEEPYIEITYNLTLRRQSATYNALVITPATSVYPSSFDHDIRKFIYLYNNSI